MSVWNVIVELSCALSAARRCRVTLEAHLQSIPAAICWCFLTQRAAPKAPTPCPGRGALAVHVHCSHIRSTPAQATRKHHASSKDTLNSCTHMAMHGAQARCGRSLATFLALQALIGQVLHAHRDS